MWGNVTRSIRIKQIPQETKTGYFLNEKVTRLSLVSTTERVRVKLLHPFVKSKLNSLSRT